MNAYICVIYIFLDFRDVNKVGDGIGSKFGRIIFSLAGFFAGYIIGFIYCWQLTLVMLAQLPLVFIVGGIMATVSSLNVFGIYSYSKCIW